MSEKGSAELPGRWLAIAVAVSAVVVIALMVQSHIELDVRDHVDQLLGVAAEAMAVARIGLRAAKSRAGRIARDAIDHVGLFAAICLVGALASYPVAADTHGFDDSALEYLDHVLRFDWISWYDVVAAHPALQVAETLAYQSIFITPAILLGYFAATGRRAEARLFIASFWLAALLTLMLFALAPAQGPLAYLWHGRIPYMPESALYQAQVISSLRQHALHDVAVESLHGLVGAPSFHTVSAVLYIIAAWPIPRLRWPLLALNAAMLLATPVEGTHYLVDMIFGVLVALTATAVVRQGVVSMLEGRLVRGGLDPLDLALHRASDRDLIALLATERTSGPRSTAILKEIERRGLDD